VWSCSRAGKGGARQGKSIGTNACEEEVSYYARRHDGVRGVGEVLGVKLGTTRVDRNEKKESSVRRRIGLEVRSEKKGDASDNKRVNRMGKKDSEV